MTSIEAFSEPCSGVSRHLSAAICGCERYSYTNRLQHKSPDGLSRLQTTNWLIIYLDHDIFFAPNAVLQLAIFARLAYRFGGMGFLRFHSRRSNEPVNVRIHRGR